MSANWTKYAGESRTWQVQWAQKDEIIAGDSISAVNVTASPSGLTIGATAIAGSNTEVVISGGTSGTLYTVTHTITTSSGATLIDEPTMQVL